jgi:hypothetical protein
MKATTRCNLIGLAAGRTNGDNNMKIIHEEVFSCTPAALFSWLAAPERAMAWMKTVSKTEIRHRTEDKIGTTFS